MTTPALRGKIPPLIRRNTLLLASSQALVGAGMQMTPTLGAIMVVRLLGSASLAGIGTSLVGFSRFLIAYPVGKTMDTYGRRAGVVLGLLLSLLGAVVTGLSMVWVSFPVFFVGIALWGLGVGATQQLRVAATDMYPSQRRAEGLGYVLTGSLVGAAGGPALISTANASSHRLGVDPIALAWLLVPILIVPSIVLVLQVRPDPKEIAAHLEHYYPHVMHTPAPEQKEASPQGELSFVRDSRALTAFASSFAAQGNMSMMMAMTSLALDHHGYALPAISFSVFLHVMGMFGFSVPIGKASDKLGRRPILMLGTVVAGIGSLLVVATADYWIITAGTFLVGVGWSCVTVGTTALLADITIPRQRGRAIGVNDTFSAASAGILPLIAGPVVDHLGLMALGYLGVIVLAVPFALLMRMREKRTGT